MAFLATISQLFHYSLTRKKRVFSISNVADVTIFQNLSFPSLSLSRTIFNPKHYFIQTPSFSSKFSEKSFQGMYFLHYSHLLFSDYAEFMLRVFKIGDFRKLGWISFSSEYFSKSLIGLCPICCLCICVGPLWQFDHVLRYFSICSCIFHNYCALLHVMCLTDCLSDNSVLFWTQLSSNLWCWSCLIIWIIFWSSCVCFTHFVQFVPQCHAMHTLGTL